MYFAGWIRAYAALELFDYIGEFIEVAINMILFTREVYPESKAHLVICIIEPFIRHFYSSESIQCKCAICW